MTTLKEPIRKRKLSDEVQERVLSLIRDGALTPGDPLPSERELMQAYSVGRPAIREAMQNLEHLGLVEIRQGDRVRIAEPSFSRMVDQMSKTMVHLLTHSPASIEHLKEARSAFEREMVRIAAKRRSGSDLSRLRRAISEQESVSDDAIQFMECDGIFHREIAVISGNPIFSSLSESLFRWLAQFHDYLVRSAGRERLTIIEHTEIVDAIELGNPIRAAKAIDDHLNRTNTVR